jgi:hypothetical protein
MPRALPWAKLNRAVGAEMQFGANERATHGLYGALPCFLFLALKARFNLARATPWECRDLTSQGQRPGNVAIQPCKGNALGISRFNLARATPWEFRDLTSQGQRPFSPSAPKAAAPDSEY